MICAWFANENNTIIKDNRSYTMPGTSTQFTSKMYKFSPSNNAAKAKDLPKVIFILVSHVNFGLPRSVFLMFYAKRV